MIRSSIVQHNHYQPFISLFLDFLKMVFIHFLEKQQGWLCSFEAIYCRGLLEGVSAWTKVTEKQDMYVLRSLDKYKSGESHTAKLEVYLDHHRHTLCISFGVGWERGVSEFLLLWTVPQWPPCSYIFVSLKVWFWV